MLVAQDAARFADEMGIEPESMLADKARAAHDRWLEANVRAEDREDWPDVPLARYAWASSKDYTRVGTTAFMPTDVKADMAWHQHFRMGRILPRPRRRHAHHRSGPLR
jgi:hypothetical protein